MSCIFCKIVKKEIPAEIIFEDRNFISFKDIKPKAPVHILIVPKKHIVSINHLRQNDRELMGELFLVTKKIAKKNKADKKGYKLVFNVGRGGGQMIDHLHLHFLTGWKSPKERDVPGMP